MAYRKGRAPFTRRRFLGHCARGSAALSLTGAFASNLVLQGCSSAEATTTRGACYHDCPDTCAWLTTVENGRVTGFQGDPEHPLTRGELCVKMSDFPTDVVYNPDRILYPLRRVGAKGEGRFERTTWDQALGAVAGGIEAAIAEHGPTAVLPYSYMGTQGLVPGGSTANALTPDGLSDLGEGADFHDARVEVEKRT